MKTIGERFDEMAEAAGVSKNDKSYYFGRSCCFQIAAEQKAINDTELAKLKKELLLATTFAVKAKEKEIVDKACEWLMKYFVIEHEGMSPSECDVFLRKFRKAMEDE